MAKGGSFEREIAIKLSLWISEGERDDLICRTDSSGGRATVRTRKSKTTNKHFFGDLRSADETASPLFDIWSIECKSGYSRKGKLWSDNKTRRVTGWDVLDLIDSKQKEPMFLQFQSQCEKDAKLSGREPILIFRRNLKDVCIAINNSYYWTLNDYFGEMKETITIQHKRCNVVIMRFDDFLCWANAQILMAVEIP
jgi:hypothetical protein